MQNGAEHPNPLSRSNTPSAYPSHHPHLSASAIAPQHLFDAVLTEAFAPTADAGGFAVRHPSPSSLDVPQSYDALRLQNQELRTRVSELEVIQDLFRGRVEELERSEREAREEMGRLKMGMLEVGGEGEGPAMKRARTGDVGEAIS